MLPKAELSPPSTTMAHATAVESSGDVTADNTNAAKQSVGTIAAIQSRVAGSVQRFKSFRKTDVPFPPPSWGVDSDIFPQPTSQSKSHPETPRTEEPNQEEFPQSQSEPTAVPSSEMNPPAELEPTYLARKIRSLIDALPSVPLASNSASPANQTDADDNTIPPRPPTPAGSLLDAKLKALLSSEAVMNGSLARGSQSVWSVLDSLRSGKKKGDTTSNNQDEEEGDDEGVMMYAPLIPSSDSQLELADSTIVEDDLPTDAKESFPGGSKSKGKGKEKVPKQHLEYVPSPTKLSLQCNWWGYRLYLPKPVLDILDNQSIVTAKRAMLLTTSLKWLLDKIPLLMVPPQARPALMLIKRLTPYLGYVGTFIAWSWGSIKKHDEGYGVVLTATWLLPVALVPSSYKPSEAQRAVIAELVAAQAAANPVVPNGNAADGGPEAIPPHPKGTGPEKEKGKHK